MDSYQGIWCNECDTNIDVSNVCEHFVVEDIEGEPTESENGSASTFEEILIGKIQNMPALWDSRLPLELRSKSIKDKLWLEIFNCLEGQFSIDIIQKKWRYLRDTYLKTKTDLETYIPSGSGRTKTKKIWKYYDALKFLSDTMDPRPTKTNLISSVTVSPGPSSSESYNSNTISKIKGKTKKSGDLEIALLDAIKTLPAPVSIAAPTSGPLVNPICLRISEMLETLPQRKRLKLEIDLLKKTYDAICAEEDQL
ncbi:hypothetical protein FQR65_LT17671 [Abscondita terminalis]|nr:hypothetical protein FQR65_LT17671 [Abscondita terminalis]